VRRITKAALTLAATVTMVAALAEVAAGPASAKPYPPPSIHLLCTAAANGGTLHGSICALPSGVTTAPNNYSATIAVSKAGAAGAVWLGPRAANNQPGWAAAGPGPVGAGSAVPRARPDSRFAAAAWKRVMSP
jgi:hypothetical protein